eukprot:TRINITY_DN7217_c0_g1_i1.p1 TRINITY_DN7217_c0_g1~~TRINITY_DN7217_c0_g1_i1.p1  ORF type:complete len:225 (-),score=31.54 TRINITY_DN7217_c0_g1_i1:166-840(-)
MDTLFLTTPTTKVKAVVSSNRLEIQDPYGCSIESLRTNDRILHVSLTNEALVLKLVDGNRYIKGPSVTVQELCEMLVHDGSEVLPKKTFLHLEWQNPQLPASLPTREQVFLHIWPARDSGWTTLRKENDRPERFSLSDYMSHLLTKPPGSLDTQVWKLDILFDRQEDLRKYRRVVYGLKPLLLDIEAHLKACLEYIKHDHVDESQAPKYRIYGSLEMERWQGLP